MMSPGSLKMISAIFSLSPAIDTTKDHTILTDNNGKRSSFLRDFHHLSTKVINKASRVWFQTAKNGSISKSYRRIGDGAWSEG